MIKNLYKQTHYKGVKYTGREDELREIAGLVGMSPVVGSTGATIGGTGLKAGDTVVVGEGYDKAADNFDIFTAEEMKEFTVARKQKKEVAE